MIRDRIRLAVIFIAFQAGWFACVLGAAEGHDRAGIAAVCVAIMVTAFVAKAPWSVLVLAGLGPCIGLVVEWLLLASGTLTYAQAGPPLSLPPAWILALWAGFAAITGELLGWMQGRVLLQAACGIIGAPLSYAAGARLGAMTFYEPRAAGLALIALIWGLAFPIVMRAARALA